MLVVPKGLVWSAGTVRHLPVLQRLPQRCQFQFTLLEIPDNPRRGAPLTYSTQPFPYSVGLIRNILVVSRSNASRPFRTVF